MSLSPLSEATLMFAEHLKQRSLGNDDDQRFCTGAPNRNYDFGILFSQTDAERNLSRHGDRTDIRPNALSIRFQIRSVEKLIRLSLTPSFWVYFRLGQNELPNDAGDLYHPDVVWSSWNNRHSPIGSSHAELHSQGTLQSYVRSRYCQKYNVSLKHGDTIVQNLDLENYRKSRSDLGYAADWSGEIFVRAERVADDLTEVMVSLVNTLQYSNQPRGELAWFDVRLRIELDNVVEEIFCPLLDTEVRAQTVNCVLVNGDGESLQQRIEVEQVNFVVNKRKQMIPATAFEESTWKTISHNIASFLEEGSAEHANALREAIAIIKKDQVAIQSIDIVLEAYRRAMRIRAKGKSWHRHQLALLVLGAAHYLTNADNLDPIVLNVPTAGGKTEAFSLLALWTVAYEAIGPKRRWGTAIIKYPTKMLSSDQASRLAHYVMHFDIVLAEATKQQEKARGLGLFFGSDPDNIDRLEIIGSECPECGQSWNVQTAPLGRPKQVECPNGHKLVVALHDEIFPRPPTLIVATIDKFVSKARKTEMRYILGGGQLWYCPELKWFHKKEKCWNNQTKSYELHNHIPVNRQSRLTMIVLDEAHLLREEVGTLDSHFETHYLESARELGGRYPMVIVSTATIAQAGEHCKQLGLGKAKLFPSSPRRENHHVYYQLSHDSAQHIVMSFMPRGRAIAWALPHLFKEYLNVLDVETDRVGHLRPAMIYCGSYITRNQTLNSIRRHVDPDRPRETRIEEFSRRHFDRVGMRNVMERLADLDVVVSTNIAAVGVDLGELNVIFYFGMPYNVSEFIQSMNRTGRRDPAIVCVVHNPYLERDTAFYAYMQPFLQRPEELVEAVPLNRFARKALEHTFTAIALSQLQHIWSSRMPQGTELRRARRFGWFKGDGFREAHGRTLNDSDVENLFHRTYRSEEDPSNAYSAIIKAEWHGMVANILNYRPQGRGQPDYIPDDNWIWYADGIQEPMFQLRLPEPRGTLEYTSEARQLLQANISVIYGTDRDERASIRDEEIDIQDGASNDSPPELVGED